MTPFKALVLFTLSAVSIYSAPLWALDILVVDQHGKPVKDAFVAIPEGEIDKASESPATMDQLDVAFVPHVLAVDQGQAVVFPNSDNIRHHVYSFSEPKKFEIKLYQGVPEQPINFEQPGLVALGCNIHDSMLGYIYVSPWPEYAVTGENGKLKFSQEPAELAIWHPRLKGKKGLIRQKLNLSGDTDSVEVAITLKKQKRRRKFQAYRRGYDD